MMNVNMNMGEMSLTELQEIAMRQQQQIEINQQLLVAKEKRLKMLKLEEQKNQQLSQLSQQPMISNEANTGTSNNQKLENLKQNVLSQELKIFKLKQLRNQILEYKLSNSNMYSELDLIKSLFADKERELFKAVNKVTELNKQIEQLKKMKSANKSTSGANGPAGSNMNELEKLKQELVIRNKLNEQQAKKIIQQHDVFNKKQLEVLTLDKRIEELKARIAAKRSQQLKNNSFAGNALVTEQENALFSRVNHFIDEQQQQQQQQQQPMFNEQNQTQSGLGSSRVVASQVLIANNTNNVNNSPSKQSAKFATKQEIANTYMNHQTKYHQQLSNRLQQQQQQQPLAPTPTPVQQQQQIPFIQLNNNHAKQTSHDENESTTSSSHSSSNLPSSSSSSLSPNNQFNNQQPQQPMSLPLGLSMQSQQQQQQQQHTIAQSMSNQQANEVDGSTLPSHLKLEFDKIKFLPDVVKTIKKRHSISEMEGSVNTLPPQIIQKLLEKHQHQHQLSKINECNENTKPANEAHQQQQQAQVQTKPSTSNEMTIKSTTVELVKPNQQQQNSQPQQQAQNTVFLSTFMSSQSNESKQRQQQQQQPVQPTTQQVTHPAQQQIVTKSIIKQTNIDMQNQQAETITTTSTTVSRRVNFDPHALLLDAAVEGELDLVMLCAQKVNDISEPNDEGITALHNSVCAGHFDIVQFLVDYCCDVNYADNDGWTPLHCAASCNNIQMIKFLIENGASIFATTVSDNETAINKCEEDEDGYQMCFDYLFNAQNMMGNEKFNNGIVFALYSYDAENEDELSFKCNDKLKVVDKHEQEDDINDGWWTCRLVDEQAENGNVKEGLVPKNYLGLYPRVASRRINLAKLSNENQENQVDQRRTNQQEQSSTVC